MSFKKSDEIDIWKLSDAETKKLPPGQWVHAGEKSNKGMFLGVKESGTVVVAWLQNAKNSRNYNAYISSCRRYAKGE